MGIGSPIFITIVCVPAIKSSGPNVKKLWINKYIHGFWVSYGLIKIKLKKTRKITILYRGTSKEKIYQELRVESLASRRWFRKLFLF